MFFEDQISNDLDITERNYLLKAVSRCDLTTSKEIQHEIMNMIHTSLFEWKRCDNIYLPNEDLLSFASSRLSRTPLKHFGKMINYGTNKFYIRARWDNNKNDVVYELRAMFPPSKACETNAVQELSEYVASELYMIRQDARVMFRKLWKEARETIAAHKEKMKAKMVKEE